MLQQLKNKLYTYCCTWVAQRNANAEEALASVKEAGNDETKSTSGDKHETGRAMMQGEAERYQVQLQKARELEAELQRINPEQQSESIIAGSLVETAAGRFYIAIGIGKITVDGNDYFVLSEASPLGAALKGKKAGETFLFQQKQVMIKKIV
jgi:transcription elongation GreA/GreB family factor